MPVRKPYSQPKPAKAPAVAEPLVRYGAAKQRLNLTVRADLIERARREGLNLSRVLEESLRERLRKTEGARWLAENTEAIAAYNARIERDGLWHKGLTPWY